jgi:hypothetical protein
MIAAEGTQLATERKNAPVPWFTGEAAFGAAGVLNYVLSLLTVSPKPCFAKEELIEALKLIRNDMIPSETDWVEGADDQRINEPRDLTV